MMTKANTSVKCTEREVELYIVSSMRRGEIESWILWAYGALCAALILMIQVFDAIVTEGYESWYANFSFVTSASVAMLLVGALLLGAFRQPYAYSLPICTIFCVWPLLWFLQMFDLWIATLFDMRGDAFLYTIVLSVICMVTALPRVVYGVHLMVRHFVLARRSSA